MITIIVAAVLTCELLMIIPIVGNVRLVAASARKAGQVISNKMVSDHWKEKIIPAYAKRIGFGSLKLFAQMLLAFSPFALLGLFYTDGLSGLGATLAQPIYIIGLTLFSVAYMWLRNRIRKSTNDGSDYSVGDRLLHRLALGTPILPEVIHDVEKAAFLKRAPQARKGQHVFICGLARAGTTVLMREIYATGSFGSLAYRDMPFVLAPNLWAKLSGKRTLETRERAHGDSIMVDLESPEALDEVYWRVMCSSDYIFNNALKPHEPDSDELEGFEALVRLVLLRTGRERYLSKNNNNILRIPALAKQFPNARFLVPIRDPRYHAASLMKQHERFGNVDKFTADYMRWLGHHEFGADHRPFQFHQKNFGTPDMANYWLQLWIATHEHLIDTMAKVGSQIIPVDMAELPKHPEKWQTLLDAVGINSATPTSLRAPSKSAPPNYNSKLLLRADEIYTQLLELV